MTTELQAELNRRLGDDRKEWEMVLGENSELESESQRSKSKSCIKGLESDSFWFQDSSPTSLKDVLLFRISITDDKNNITNQTNSAPCRPIGLGL